MLFDGSQLAAMKLVKADIMPLPPTAKPEFIFLTEETAMKYAEKKAGEHPGSLIMILKAIDVVEAGKPPLIHKTYNENGELVPK